jgi:hypothetical protein
MRAAIIYSIICLVCTWFGYVLTIEMVPAYRHDPFDNDSIASIGINSLKAIFLIFHSCFAISATILGALAGFSVGTLIVGLSELIRRCWMLRQAISAMNHRQPVRP